MKILVVDDDKSIRSLLNDMLKSLSHETLLASNGQEGLDLIKTNTLDAIICDICMPGMDGIAFLREVQELSDPPPVILLTAYASLGSAVEAIRLGAADYLYKPIDINMFNTSLLRVERENELKRKLEREIENRIKAEAKVKEGHLRELLLDSLPHPTMLIRKDRGVIEANRIARELGVKIGGYCWRDFGQCEFMPDKNRQDVNRTHRTAPGGHHCTSCLADQAMNSQKHVNAPEIHAFGRIWDAHWTPLDEELYLHYAIDITERKHLEQQMRQSEKMQAVGQLAAGVAHEINNPVGFIMSNLGTMIDYTVTFKKLLGEYEKLREPVANRKWLEVDEVISNVTDIQKKEDISFILDDVDNLLKESLEGSERVRDIAQGLKSFARTDGIEKKNADINEGIAATLKIVWNELKYHCQVHNRFGSLPLFYCNPGQLNQVFMNLLVNASHAISNKGEITIETEADDCNIIVRISDTGSGITSENLPKLFDPFFTTKEVGKGTGLGLAISYRIIEDHKGKIEVESEVGKGTTFTIRLPINSDA